MGWLRRGSRHRFLWDQSAERGGAWVSACWWGRRITPFAVFIVEVYGGEFSVLKVWV